MTRECKDLYGLVTATSHKCRKFDGLVSARSPKRKYSYCDCYCYYYYYCYRYFLLLWLLYIIVYCYCHCYYMVAVFSYCIAISSAGFLGVTIVPFSVAGHCTCAQTGSFIRRIPPCHYRAIQCCGPLHMRRDREFYPPDSSVSLSCHSVLRAIAPASRQGVLSAGFLGVTIVPFSVAGHCTCAQTGSFIRRIPRCHNRAIQCCGPLHLRVDRGFYPPDSSVSLSCHSVLRAVAPANTQGVLSAAFLGVTIVPFSVAGHCTCEQTGGFIRRSPRCQKKKNVDPFLYLYLYLYIYIYICKYICKCICICICVYVYIHSDITEQLRITRNISLHTKYWL